MLKRRISELDSLRGIAAVGVMLYHYSARFSEKFNTDVISKHFLFEYGKYGVDLFFVISGFVIYMSVNKIESPKDFIVKRFNRLYPTFWIAMIITFIIVHIWGPESLSVSMKDLLLNFTMIPSLFSAKPVDGVYWTLKVELFFYLVILFLLMAKWINKVPIIGCLYLMLGGILLFFSESIPSSIVEMVLNYYYYGLLFLCGVNFYHILENGPKLWNYIQVGTASILTMIAQTSNFPAFLIIICIFVLLVNQKIAFLSIGPLLFLGRISYPMYLLHQNIGYTIGLNLISIGISNYLVLLIVPMIISVLASWVVADYIDQKFTLVISQITRLRYLLR